MLKLGENNLVSLKKFAKGIMYYVKKTKKRRLENMAQRQTDI